jgi:uncharacterized membrane protein YbjE (DUF340 family)
MYILIFIIALSSAVMDTLKDKFSVSIFKNLNPYFWNPAESWKNKYKNRDKTQGKKYPEYLSGLTDSFSDAWHIFKFLIVVCIIIGFSIEKDFNIYYTIIYWLEYGLVFKLFYKILSK